MAKIIKSCYKGRVKEVGVAANFDAFIASTSPGDSLATVLLGKPEGSEQISLASNVPRHRLEIFAITASSSPKIETVLDDLKNSRWWNHMAQFYIVDSPTEPAGCPAALDVLRASWMADILGAKFICDDDSEGTLIYAFNPYTKFAPEAWQLVETSDERGRNGHPWTLLVRKYSDNFGMCKNIDFDQTKDAGGYEVRVTTQHQYMPLDGGKIETFSRFPVGNAILQEMSRYMSITYEILDYKRDESLGFFDEEGTAHGMIADLIEGRSEIVFREKLWSVVPELPTMYPRLYGKLFAVTQYKDYPNQLRKVISAIDAPSRIGLCIVCLANVIFLKYAALGQSSETAVLKTIRIICSFSLVKLPNNLGARIYLVCIFSFVIVVQALYQGQLAALLARRIRYPNINNGQDLIDSDCVIYGRHNDSAIFRGPVYEGRFVGINILSNNDER